MPLQLIETIEHINDTIQVFNDGLIEWIDSDGEVVAMFSLFPTSIHTKAFHYPKGFRVLFELDNEGIDKLYYIPHSRNKARLTFLGSWWASCNGWKSASEYYQTQ
jgi:hypothetical protein